MSEGQRTPSPSLAPPHVQKGGKEHGYLIVT
jgi:hypothetical protein